MNDNDLKNKKLSNSGNGKSDGMNDGNGGSGVNGQQPVGGTSAATGEDVDMDMEDLEDDEDEEDLDDETK